METTHSTTQYDLISQICTKNATLKRLFATKKDINVAEPSEIQDWLELISAVNLELAEQVGKIEVLIRWYKMLLNKSDASADQLQDTEKQVANILIDLMNIDLERIDIAQEDEPPEASPQELEQSLDFDFGLNLNPDASTEQLSASSTSASELEQDEPDIQVETANDHADIDLDFHLTFQDKTPPQSPPPPTSVPAAVTESQESIPVEPEIPLTFAEETVSSLPEETTSEPESAEVNLFDDSIPLEAADLEAEVYAEGTPITLKELQYIFNRISKLSLRYLGGTLTKNYFTASQPDDPWTQKFQMDPKGHILVSGIPTQEVSPQEVITFKQWLKKFIKNCSQIISNFPVMVKKNNLLGRLG